MANTKWPEKVFCIYKKKKMLMKSLRGRVLNLFPTKIDFESLNFIYFPFLRGETGMIVV